MSNFRLYFAFFHSEMPEKSSKQVSVPQQRKEVCLTVSFENRNFVLTSKWQNVDFTSVGNLKDAFFT